MDKKMLHEPPLGQGSRADHEPPPGYEPPLGQGSRADHEPRPGHGPGRSQARGETLGNGVEYQSDGHAGPQTSRERHRQEVLLRVVRISDALNQRLAL